MNSACAGYQNYLDLGQCYLPQPSASADNIDLGLNNSGYPAQPHPIIVNYLPNSLEITDPAVFAGDTSLTATGESSSEIDYKLHGVEIQTVKTWLDANKLTLNE